MDNITEFINMGGEVHIGTQRNKLMLSVSYEQDGQRWRKGCYFKDQDQLLLYLQQDGDFLEAAIRGLQNLKAEVRPL